jgi:hypothetical protein
MLNSVCRRKRKQGAQRGEPPFVLNDCARRPSMPGTELEETKLALFTRDVFVPNGYQ